MPLFPFMVSQQSSTPVELTYDSFTSAGIVGSPYTFTNHSIGAASEDRFVVVCMSVSNVAPPTVCTVAGQTTTLVGTAITPATGNRSMGVFVTNAAVTTGTTADIVCTTGGTRDLEIAVYTLKFAATPTAPDYSTSDTKTTSTMDVSVNTLTGGAVLAVGIFYEASINVVWTGVTTDVENTSVNYQAEYNSYTVVSPETPRIIVTDSFAGYGGALSLSWGP